MRDSIAHDISYQQWSTDRIERSRTTLQFLDHGPSLRYANSNKIHHLVDLAETGGYLMRGGLTPWLAAVGSCQNCWYGFTGFDVKPVSWLEAG
jgi:hypothetical protein